MSRIKLKRKKSAGTSGVVLTAGEPVYNLVDKTLYIGNTDNESVDSTKKHIAQIDSLSTKSDVIKFSVGENSNNIFEKTVDNVEHSKSVLWNDYESRG